MRVAKVANDWSDPPRPDRFYGEALLTRGLRGLRRELNGDARKPVRSFEACLSGGSRGNRCKLNRDARKPVRSFEAGRKWLWGDMPGILLQDAVIPFRSLKYFRNLDSANLTSHLPERLFVIAWS